MSALDDTHDDKPKIDALKMLSEMKQIVHTDFYYN